MFKATCRRQEELISSLTEKECRKEPTAVVPKNPAEKKKRQETVEKN